MSLHGLECAVLGTFIPRDDGAYRYAEDIANYYAVNELMVWKPDAESLDLIVNHQHRTNDIPIARKAAKIGRTRFAAAEPDDATVADFKINPTDIMKRRTAYFGMSRSGKSNGLKIVAENIYRIREDNAAHRIGQRSEPLPKAEWWTLSERNYKKGTADNPCLCLHSNPAR